VAKTQQVPVACKWFHQRI